MSKVEKRYSEMGLTMRPGLNQSDFKKLVEINRRGRPSKKELRSIRRQMDSSGSMTFKPAES